jgi:hypothetical protein
VLYNMEVVGIRVYLMQSSLIIIATKLVSRWPHLKLYMAENAELCCSRIKQERAKCLDLKS